MFFVWLFGLIAAIIATFVAGLNAEWRYIVLSLSVPALAFGLAAAAFWRFLGQPNPSGIGTGWRGYHTNSGSTDSRDPC